ncbi:lantibiotic efflux protein [Streptococcus suis]|nr:lantibiotic efflux protein [Streptococcus suis]
MKRLIHNKLFLSSFVADLISNFGDTLYYLALMNYVLLLPDTKFALAMITASETLPILAGLFIGIWADKTKTNWIPFLQLWWFVSVSMPLLAS